MGGGSVHKFQLYIRSLQSHEMKITLTELILYPVTFIDMSQLINLLSS